MPGKEKNISPEVPSRGHAIIPILAILAAVALVYGRALWFDFTGSDEIVVIQNNQEFLRNLSNLPATFSQTYMGYYRPMVLASLIIDTQWLVPGAFVYHTTNLVIHFLSCSLLFVLLRKLNFQREVALFVALLFAVHPLSTQAVVWVVGRNDSLACLFLLFAMSAFVEYQRQRKLTYLILHFVGFAFCLFTKEIGIVIPLLSVAAIVLLEKKPKSSVAWVPLGIGWGVLLITWYVLRYRTLAGAAEPADIAPSAILKNLPSLFDALGKYFIPLDMSVMATVHTETFMLGVVAFAAIVLFVGRTWRTDRTALFGFVWFLLLFIPSLTVRLQNASEMFDYLEQRAYAPMAGLAILTASLATKLQFSVSKKTLTTAAVVILVGFGVRAFIYSDSYRNPILFYTNAVQTSPDRAANYYNRGRVYLGMKEYKSAEEDFLKAVELNPKKGEAFVNLGQVYFETGKMQKALAAGQKAAELNPGNANALTLLEWIYIKLDDPNGTIGTLTKLLNLQPTETSIYVQLSMVYVRTHQLDSAVAILQRANALAPTDGSILINLGNVYSMKGDNAAALEIWKRAVQLSPDDVNAYNNLFLTLMKFHRYKEAVPYALQLERLGERLSLDEQKLIAPYR